MGSEGSTMSVGNGKGLSLATWMMHHGSFSHIDLSST